MKGNFKTEKEARAILEPIASKLGVSYLLSTTKIRINEDSTTLGRKVAGCYEDWNRTINIHKNHRDLDVLLHEFTHLIQCHIYQTNTMTDSDSQHDQRFIDLENQIIATYHSIK